MKFRNIIAVVAVAAMALTAAAHDSMPKREFRGAWIPTVGDSYYAGHTTEQNKAYLINMLDSIKATGCNAIIFHCRPQADAFYPSAIEPWSKWISGTPGVGPDPEWDPMEMMVEESHKRGMELHAWINPYRVGYPSQIADNNLCRQHPEWFLQYGGQTYFDPAYKECRDHINSVVRDLVTRYDIDAVHMDDFFYPYPKDGEEFPDTASYNAYGIGWERGDWRRHNVDLLIEDMHNTIVSVKPWVRLGISPFGIWRNKGTDANGSNTTGLQCYDALYADCPKWTGMGWVDYLVPQLYWQLEHKAASDSVLFDWWDTHANGRHMFYGLAIRNTMNFKALDDTTNPTQLNQKMRMMRRLANVQGVVWWPCYDITGNYKGFADSLTCNEQRTVALPPAYPWISTSVPAEVTALNVVKSGKTKKLTWQAPTAAAPVNEARFYVIYRFKDKEATDLNNADAVIGITGETSFALPKKGPKGKHRYVVTVLDRCNNESPNGTAVVN